MAVKLEISEVLEKAAALPTKADKVAFLQSNYSVPLTLVLRAALDPNIKWALPEGAPPYTINPYPGQEGALYSEARRLYLFVEGGNPNLTAKKREHLFVQFLEMLTPKDAQLVLAAKEKKLPYKGITAKLVNEAFPGLISET